jgi:prepilin-type N-terminal cleavage/methylation domain-containing protein
MKVGNNIRTQGFTLIELIGVLAIIGILAGILLPKVVQATARGKVNSTVFSINTLKTAAADYFGKNGSFPLRAGTGANNGAVANGRFDADLLSGGFLDKLYSCAVGIQLYDTSALTGRTHVRSRTALNNGTVTINLNNGGNNFDLDSNTATADFTTANTIVSLMIPGTSVTDAVELNKLIDNETVTGATQNLTGRCIFSTPINGVTTVYVYLVHN